jgi:hypothetical protein
MHERAELQEVARPFTAPANAAHIPRQSRASLLALAAVVLTVVLATCLAGCASAPPIPDATLNATSISFAAQLANTPSTSQTVVLSNSGTGPLLISGIHITAPNQAAFLQTNTCANTLLPNTECTISVQFTPPAQGSYTANLTIADNAGNQAQTVALTGTGIAPQASFTATQLTFPSTDAGYASLPQTLQLTNTGTAPLLTSTLTLSGAGAAAFQQSSNCPASLAMDAACTLSFTFAPGTTGNYAAVLSASGAGTQSVTVTATATPDTPLSAWHNALVHCHTQPVNVVIIGDSRSIADNTILPGIGAQLSSTFGSKWADLLAASLQSTCGSHGSGLVPFLPLAQNHVVNADFYSIDGDWTTYAGFGPYQGDNVPVALTLQTSSPLTINFSYAFPYDTLNAYCEAGPGLHAWTLEVDGNTVGACGGPDATEHPVLGTSTKLASATHAAALVCTQSPCIAYGMEAVSGTTGVSVHNIAVSSCAVECFGLNPQTQLAFSDLIPNHHLVILDMVTNEAIVGYSVDSYTAAIDRILAHEQAAATRPSLLVVAPLQDVLGGQSPYYNALPAVASANNAAFTDVRTTNGDNFLPQDFGPDGIHENNAGHQATFAAIQSALGTGTTH